MIRCALGFGGNVDAEPVSVRITDQRGVLSFAEIVMGIGEPTAPTVRGNNASDETARDLTGAVRQVARLVVAPDLTFRQVADRLQEISERDAPI